MVKVEKRKPRVNITQKQRLVLIKRREESSLKKEAFAQKYAQKYNVTPKTISRFLRSHEKSPNMLSMKKNGSYYPSFEQWLGKYFQNMRKAKSKISLVKLEGMALKIKSEMLNKGVSSCKDQKEFIALKKFKCSRGYLQKYLKRCAGNNGKSMRLHGEGGSCDDDYLQKESVKKKLDELKKMTSNFPLERIWNMDETGLLYKKLPDRTYVADFEDEEETRGVDDQPKDRLTIACCISAAGEKLPVLVIDTADWPYCFYDKGKTKKVIVFRQ